MKIAVCFSGLIRTGINCYVNITRYLGDMLPDCDFFLHTWDYETNKPFARTHWNNIRFIQRPDEALSQEKLQKFIELYNPIRYKVDSYSEFMNSHMTNNQFPIVWHTLCRSFELKRQYEIENNFKYDVVIKIRPDVIFPTAKNFGSELSNIDLSKSTIYSDPHCDNRLADVFWVTNSNVADIMIDLVKEPGHSVHDSSAALNRFLQNRGIINQPLSKTNLVCYTIYRYESYMFDPMTNFRECFMNDLIHYSSISEEEIYKVFRDNNENKLYGTIR